MKRAAPAAERNKEPIAEALARILPERGTVLEIASGTGQHAAHFAGRFPGLRFVPTDAAPDALASIEAHRAEAGLDNLAPAERLDVLEPGWEREVDAIVCINMIHISPFEATLALFAGAARCLAPSSPLVLYGPYRFGGRFLAESNAVFDASLRERDARWGVRDVDELARVARDSGFALEEPLAMPANNHVLVARRGA
jgi:cyclopropane fatty-acyl-phospholipid synthase-like methyltransferase